MRRIVGIRLMVSSGALALALAPCLLHAQMVMPMRPLAGGFHAGYRWILRAGRHGQLVQLLAQHK